jgi:hypothetical protein
MGVTRTHGFDIPFIRGIHRNTDTAAYTLTAADSGIVFINAYDTGACTYTLPACSLGKGKCFWFYSGTTGASSSIVITSPTANTLVCNDDALATTNTQADCAGEWAFVIGDGTYWYCFEGSGSWAEGG